ncbi:O81 family O-antigen flippase [Shewanella sp. 0m-4]
MGYKSKNIAFLGLVSTGLKLFTGPFTMLIIAKTLDSEELGFYYIFFTLIAMKQLLEIGMGGVIKHFYASEVPESKMFTDENRRNVSSLYAFSYCWYFLLAILFVLLGFFAGEINFSEYSGDVKWEFAWYAVLLSSALNLLVMPKKIYLEGMQFQIKLNLFEIVTQLFTTFALWLCLYSQFGLISIAISQFVGAVVFVIVFHFNKLQSFEFDYSDYNFKVVFKKLYPLLKKTGLVWFMGYFYWNGFNIIAFNYLGPSIAGAIGLSIALARAGVGIAGSVIVSQITIFSNLISNSKQSEAFDIFKLYSILSNVVLFVGYFVYIMLMLVFPGFYFFDKTLDVENMIIMFVFFMVAHNVSLMDSYTRCYKVELFVFIQFINSILTPFCFYLSIRFGFEYFVLPIISILGVFILTIRKFNGLVYKSL